ncbi:MAG: hypothetical protein H0U90_07445 [Actinobacteria bacterium]|nr:hypothetical protein [Actinomycetota bacterium]
MLATGGPAFGQAACDPVMPTSEIASGMTGVGWSVSRGRTREPFTVEVLGVLKDGVGPGRDMVVVQASGPMVTAAGGIWSGMSGSPVYIGGRLAGALAFGFSATSNVAGLTPAQDMAQLLSFRRLGLAQPETVPLSRSLAGIVAARTGRPVSAVDSMTQLRIPLSVSGLNARGMREVRAWAAKRDLAAIPFAGSAVRTSAAPAAATPPLPGENFAAVAAYGDVTMAGIGTTTWSCGDEALAFGHPFFHAGEGPSGANAADALAIVGDSTFGPFKLAAVAETLGTVDQDRLAGLRARIGAGPPTTPIRSVLSASDRGNFRNGGTDVVLPELVPTATFFHLLSNVDSTYDSIGRGTAALNWTFEGRRADGSPWRLSRGNLIASRFDVAIESADAIAFQLDMLQSNPSERVEVTSVQVEGAVETAVRQYTLTRVLVAKGARAPFKRVRRAIGVEPGMLLRVRSFLKHFESGATRRLDLRVRVPRRGAPFGALQIGGGMFRGGEECEGEECGEAMFGSFDALLAALQNAPRNDVLVARLRLGPSGQRIIEKRARLDGVVLGLRTFELRPPGGGGCCAGPDEGP